MDDDRPEIRVGDREREQVDQRLQRAHGNGVLTLAEYDERAAACWAARTYGDLDALTRDLPPDELAPEPATTAPDVPARSGRGHHGLGHHGLGHSGLERSGLERSGRGQRRSALGQRVAGALGVVALLGVGTLVGGKALTADDGIAVFGSRQVQVSGQQDRLEVGTLFGSVTVRVPDDVRVRTSGWMVFGSVECATACQAGPTGQREVVVDTGGAFGSVEVLRQNEQTADDDAQGTDDRDDDD